MPAVRFFQRVFAYHVGLAFSGGQKPSVFFCSGCSYSRPHVEPVFTFSRRESDQRFIWLSVILFFLSVFADKYAAISCGVFLISALVTVKHISVYLRNERSRATLQFLNRTLWSSKEL